MRRYSFIVVAGALSFAWVAPATSQTSSQMTVFKTVTGVTPTLTLLTHPLSFGAADPTAPASPLGQTTLEVTGANTNLVFSISLDAGLHGPPRQLLNAAAQMFLGYALYQDAARSIPWGDGTPQLGAPVFGNASAGLTTTLTVYGSVGPVPPTPGAYTDVITATVNF